MAIITPEARRLQTVVKDQAKEPHGKSARAFARFIGISNSSLQRMLQAEQEMNYTVISAICLRLNYSPTWLLLGLGDKKLKGKEAKLVTEVHMLRAEIDITAKLNLRLQARITGIEKEHEDLKKTVEDLKQQIKK